MSNCCIWQGVNRRHEQTFVGAMHLCAIAQRNFRQFRDYSKPRDILLSALRPGAEEEGENGKSLVSQTSLRQNIACHFKTG